MKRRASVLVSILLGALAGGSIFAQNKSTGTLDSPAKYSVRTLALPDDNMGDVSMDYIAYDASTNSVWVPAGNTAAIDVVDAATGKVRQIPGLPTKEVDVRGSKRVLGPSSVSIGEGLVYIGNRGDSTACSYTSVSLARGPCAHLDSMPDAVNYVAPTKELWVFTPDDKSIHVLDQKAEWEKAKLTLEGEPEGFAVDAMRGLVYTNLQDKDRIIAIDLKTQKTVTNWPTSCGKELSHGLALDVKAGHLFVACTSFVEVLDTGHDGAIISKIDCGGGVDDFLYSPDKHLLYVGAARAAKLTIAHVDDNGGLSVITEVPTYEGVRNGVLDKNGNLFMAHTSNIAKLNALVIVSPSGK
jgi:DNA-binding beta-propeller fold protein YncE